MTIHCMCDKLSIVEYEQRERGLIIMTSNEIKGSGVRADLSDADLSNADLRNASLSCARLTGLRYNESTAMFAMACPEKGAFIGYKKHADIVELLILEDARRSSATSRKCRCDKARVLSITNMDGQDAGVDSVCSSWNNTFIYHIGSVVEEPNFSTNRWKECAPEFTFMTRGEAVNYD